MGEHPRGKTEQWLLRDRKSKMSWYLFPVSAWVGHLQLCHVCSLMICFRNVDGGRDEAYLVQVGLFISRPVYWLYAVTMVQFCEEFDLVPLDLSVQFRQRGKHPSQVKAQGALIYSTLIGSHKPHDDDVSGAALSLCSSRARQTTASPSRFCYFSAAACQGAMASCGLS